jgi:hypothetical protein
MTMKIQLKSHDDARFARRLSDDIKDGLPYITDPQVAVSLQEMGDVLHTALVKWERLMARVN